MRKEPGAAVLALILSAMAGACAGDGTGLGEGGEIEPTLASIQENVFTAICTACHTGSAAPLGLALDAGLSYSRLVGVGSVQVPALKRVAPGKPDSSYIVWKIEGRSGIIGGRMPLGLSPLTSEQIQAIRDWIAAGALQQ